MDATTFTIDQVSAMLAEAGECTTDIEEVIQDGSAPMWAVVLREDVDVIIELSPDADALCLRANLGQPPAQHRLAVCEALMTYTSLRGMTGGVTMALTGVAGDFIQSYEIPVSRLDAAALGSILVNFAAKARLWQQVVAEGAQAEGPSAQAFFMLGGAIRG